MNTQVRDLIISENEAIRDGGLEGYNCLCCVCGEVLTDDNVYSPHAHCCKDCADSVV